MCMFNDINFNLNKLYPLDRNELMLFNSCLSIVRIPKRTKILRANEIHNNIYYVTKGILKAYALDSKGNEVILHFPKEDWWVGDINSFYFGEPAVAQFETIEDSEFLFISKEKYDSLVEENIHFELAFNNLAKRYINSYQSRYIDILTLSAKTRYDKFVAKYPDVIQRVSQKSIASYLGVTPEFLSKMRSSKTFI